MLIATCVYMCFRFKNSNSYKKYLKDSNINDDSDESMPSTVKAPSAVSQRTISTATSSRPSYKTSYKSSPHAKGRKTAASKSMTGTKFWKLQKHAILVAAILLTFYSFQQSSLKEFKRIFKSSFITMFILSYYFANKLVSFAFKSFFSANKKHQHHKIWSFCTVIRTIIVWTM